MQVNLGENSLNNISGAGAFDILLGAVTGNNFFDAKVLNKIQTEEMQEAFFDWVGNEFLVGDDSSDLFKTAEELDEEEKYEGVSLGARDFVKGMAEYQEDWDNFNVAENQRVALNKQIEKLEQQQAYEMSLSDVINNNKKIASLKAQISQIQEG